MEDKNCECSLGVHIVKHVIIRCRFGVENRSVVWDEIIRDRPSENIRLENKLYSKWGVEWAPRTSAEFVKERREENRKDRVLN